MIEDEEDCPQSLEEVFHRLPIFDDLYLRMQGQNIALVDRFLYKLEDDAFSEWNGDENDRIPIEKVLFISAISQLWVFGFYELIRTWREQIRDIISYGDRLVVLAQKDPALKEQRIQQQKGKLRKLSSGLLSEFEFESEQGYYNYSLVENNPEHLLLLKKTLSRCESFFQMLELIRVNLAKHEIHNVPGSRVQAPGYARLDRVTGSLMWFVHKKDGSQIQITRREIPDQFRNLPLEK